MVQVDMPSVLLHQPKQRISVPLGLKAYDALFDCQREASLCCTE